MCEQTSAEDLIKWLQAYLSDLLGVPLEEVDPNTSFDRLGIDSATAVGLTDEVGRFIRRKVEPSLFFDHPSLGLAAIHLFPEV